MRGVSVIVFALMVLVVGCQKSGSESGPQSVRANSGQFETLEEKKEFLERYIAFRRSYEGLEFRVFFRNGGEGMVPSPSEWDLSIYAHVPKNELAVWYDEMEAVSDLELQWVSSIPSAPTQLDSYAWYRSGRVIVGIDRTKNAVLYRNFTM